MVGLVIGDKGTGGDKPENVPRTLEGTDIPPPIRGEGCPRVPVPAYPCPWWTQNLSRKKRGPTFVTRPRSAPGFNAAQNQKGKWEMNKADRDLEDVVFSAAARKHPLWRIDEAKGEAIPLDGAPDHDEMIEWFEKTYPDEFERARHDVVTLGDDKQRSP